MASVAARAEQSLSKTCATLGITEEGKRWLDIALDPFKDMRMPTAGFPDEVVLPSVVQTIHESFVVTRPASVPDTDPWDCNIFLDQMYRDLNLKTTTEYAPNNYFSSSQAGGVQSTRGGVQIRSGAAGSDLDFSKYTGNISFKEDVLPEADTRMIGCGLEIHNVTEDLHKSGALITYRISETPETVGIANLMYDQGVTACIPTSAPVTLLIAPPVNASEAIDMPGSLQWEAKDGAYIVGVLTQPTNPPKEPEAVFPVSRESDSSVQTLELQQIGAAKLIKLRDTDNNIILPFSLSGCFLTGLHPQTKLQVNLAYYIETFPSKDNPLRRLTSPSPAFDAKALELYGRIIQKLPTGVEVSENFAGGFISGIATIARGVMNYAPQIIRGIGIGANILQNGMNMFGGAPMVPLGEELLEPRPHQQLVTTRGSVQASPQLKQVIRQEVAKDVSKAIVPYRPTREIVQVVAPRNTRSNVQRNNGTVQTRTRKAKKKQNEAIRNAIAGNAGNRWVSNGKH